MVKTSNCRLIAGAGFTIGMLCTALAFASQSTIVSDFSKGRNLSFDEIEIAQRLARKAGVTNVAKIRSYYVHPTSRIVINVFSPEIVSGRSVSFVSVDIHTERLQFELTKDPKNVLCFEGNYWVPKGYFGVHTNTLTLFQVGDQSIRVRVEDKVTIELADRLVAAFAGRKIRYRVTPGDVGHLDFSLPKSIHADKDGAIWVTFSCGDWCFVSFQCFLEKDEVVVTDTISSIS